MSIRLQIANRRKKENLSFWDMCYWENNTEKFSQNTCTKDILYYITNQELKKYKKFKKIDNFILDINDNPQFDAYFNGIIKDECEESKNAKDLIEYRKMIYQELLTQNHYKDYIKILNILEKSKYQNSFKCLILNEFLTQVYLTNVVDGKTTYERHTREVNKTIRGLMHLDKFSLDYIYNYAQNYDNFTKLYFDSLKYSRQSIVTEQALLNNARKKQNGIFKSKEKDIKLKGLETFGLGQWVFFPSKSVDRKNFAISGDNLSSLVKGTSSCLVNNASGYLEEGSICVFVNNDFKPCVRVIFWGEDIAEIRGEAGGQQVEPEYLDVALKFVELNNHFKQSEVLIKYIQDHKKLYNYAQNIKNDEFNMKNLPDLLDALEFCDFVSIEGKDEYVENIKEVLPLINVDIKNQSEQSLQK